MTEVLPFRALRYDPKRVDLSRVLAPPYDVISPEERQALYDRDPHNAVRLELEREVADEAGTDYGAAARELSAWSKEGILVRDAEPAFYGLRQRFVAPNGETFVREGFFALVRLADYSERIVLPHERTLAGPKADRLKLLRATHTNLSSVFMLYEDPDNQLGEQLRPHIEAAPIAEGEDRAGVETALLRIEAPEAVAAIQSFLATRSVVIADGHHRYETALRYRDEQREANPKGTATGHEFALVYLANAYAPGSLLLPIHRVIRKGPVPTEAAWENQLSSWRQERVPMPDPDAIATLLREHLEPHGRAPAFAADDGSGTLRVFSRAADREIAIRIVHDEVIDGVFGLDIDAVRGGALAYAKDPVRAAHDVRNGRGSVALYLNALAPEDVFRVTGAGEILPQKSTFFTPKLPTGLVFRPLEDSA